MEKEPNNFEKSRQEQEDNLVKEVREKMGLLFQKDILGFHNKIVDKAEELKSKYPDYESCRMYHVLVGSTPVMSDMNYFDFPVGDSVVEFINSEFNK